MRKHSLAALTSMAVPPWATALFAAIALLIGADVTADYRSGTGVSHLLTEALVMAVPLAGRQCSGGSSE